MVSQAKHGQGLTPSRVTFSSSRNAVSFSSELTINLFPLSRRASAVKSTRPVESIWDEYPHDQPDVLSLSAIISQYFILVKTALMSTRTIGRPLEPLRREFGQAGPA